MSAWTDGYVADINYTFGFYRELTPALLALTALAKARKAPDLSAPLAYCELGCGQGLSANIIAASNPGMEVYATDFNPAQIAFAQGLAAEGGAPNIHFADASFAEYLADESLPRFDIVALHGIYSWVSVENRALLVEFIRRKLKVGGLVYISYNAQPGWSQAMPLRRLMVDHGAAAGGSLHQRIDRALAYAERLAQADVALFRATNGLKERLAKLRSHPLNYVAHEYFNRDWTPFYFGDVVAELDPAKLAFVGSVNLIDHVSPLNLTVDHLAILTEETDLVRQETLRDFLTMAQFRRDLFSRGAPHLAPAELLDAWSALRLALLHPRGLVPFKAVGALGEAKLTETIYGPVLDRLAEGPLHVRDLLADPEIGAFGFLAIQEIVKVLVGAGYVHPCLPAAGDAERAGRTRPFNAAVMRRAVWSGELQHLASPVTGGGVQVERFQQIFLLALQAHETDPAAWAWAQIAAQGQKIVKDGQTLESHEDNLAELRSRYEAFTAQALPVLQQLGVA